MVAWFRVKNRHANARKLVGPIFGLSLLFQLLYFAMQIVATMLQECKTMDIFDYYNFAIAYNIFEKLANFLLLVVVLYGVNSLLRSHSGNNPSSMKIIYGAVLGVMGILTCVVIGMQSYNYWTFTEAGWDADTYLYSSTKVAMAYYVLYLLSAIGAGVLALMAVMSMRSRSMPTKVSTTHLCYARITDPFTGPHHVGRRPHALNVLLGSLHRHRSRRQPRRELLWRTRF